MISYYPLIRAFASYFLPKKIFTRPGSGGTFSSEYCYSIWLRHLVQLKDAGLIKSVEEIKNLAEIGPGDSLGIGLSAMYTGVENYYAFDVIKHANISKNKVINDDLLNYFISGKEIPNIGHQFRNTNPVLKNYTFPSGLIPFQADWFKKRHELIEKSMENINSEKSNINYVVPWMGQKHEYIRDLDLIISQAVMEHVDDIHYAYSEMYNWLKKGGIVSHQIDFKAHEMTAEWDGHFYIKPKMWKFLSHGRKYPMNRLPLSSHLKAMEKVGFKIKNVVPVINKNNFEGRNPLIPGASFSENDFVSSSALIQAVKE
jgi:hypothetical protein